MYMLGRGVVTQCMITKIMWTIDNLHSFIPSQLHGTNLYAWEGRGHTINTSSHLWSVSAHEFVCVYTAISYWRTYQLHRAMGMGVATQCVIVLHTHGFQFMSLCVCCLCRCSCDFWSVQCPSVPCTYTLTLSAPQEEDWWGSHAPSMEGTTVEAPDLGCPCVTVGELTTTWDTLRHRER